MNGKWASEISSMLIGPLHQNWRNILDGFGTGIRAGIEIVIVTVFGALPLVAQIFRMNLTSLPDHEKFKGMSVFDMAFANGQLYFYTFAVYGTIVWLAIFDWRYVYTKVRLFFIFLVMAVGYILSSFASLDPTFSTFADKWVIDLGYVLFASSVALYWCLIVFRKSDPPKPGAVFSKGADAMASKLGAVK